VECFTSRLIFEVILRRLQQRGSDSEKHKRLTVTSRQRCDNMNDFVHQLHTVINSSQLGSKCVYIVRVCLLCMMTILHVKIAIFAVLIS